MKELEMQQIDSAKYCFLCCNIDFGVGECTLLWCGLLVKPKVEINSWLVAVPSLKLHCTHTAGSGEWCLCQYKMHYVKEVVEEVGKCSLCIQKLGTNIIFISLAKITFRMMTVPSDCALAAELNCYLLFIVNIIFILILVQPTQLNLSVSVLDRKDWFEGGIG